jgi:hypothetical protein
MKKTPKPLPTLFVVPAYSAIIAARQDVVTCTPYQSNGHLNNLSEKLTKQPAVPTKNIHLLEFTRS